MLVQKEKVALMIVIRWPLSPCNSEMLSAWRISMIYCFHLILVWYEQKAADVLLTLLSFGIKGIRLGPNLPAFISPTVLNVLVEKFDIKPIDDVDEDITAMMAGN